jgi:hypothetical protein
VVLKTLGRWSSECYRIYARAAAFESCSLPSLEGSEEGRMAFQTATSSRPPCIARARIDDGPVCNPRARSYPEQWFGVLLSAPESQTRLRRR